MSIIVPLLSHNWKLYTVQGIIARLPFFRDFFVVGVKLIVFILSPYPSTSRIDSSPY